MDRLTKVMSCSDGAKIYDVSNELFKVNCSRADKTRMILEKLADYEDLEEQGKLLKLPCSVGDIVWYADNEIKIESIKIQEKSSIVYQGSSIVCVDRKYLIFLFSILYFQNLRLTYNDGICLYSQQNKLSNHNISQNKSKIIKKAFQSGFQTEQISYIFLRTLTMHFLLHQYFHAAQ